MTDHQALDAAFDPGPDYRWEEIPADTPAAILDAMGGPEANRVAAGTRGGPRDPCRHGRALAHARATRPGRWLAAARRRHASGRSAAGLSRLLSHGRRLADADHRHALAVHRTPRALLGLGRAASQHAVAAKLGHRRPGRPAAAGRVVGRTGGRHDAHQSARSARPRRAPGGQPLLSHHAAISQSALSSRGRRPRERAAGTATRSTGRRGPRAECLAAIGSGPGLPSQAAGLAGDLGRRRGDGSGRG